MPKKILVAFLLVLLFPQPAHAATTGCNVSVSPNSLSTGVSDVLTFSITYSNSEPGNSLRWIKITAPSSNFIITSATGPYEVGVDINSTGSEVVIRVFGLQPGVANDFPVDVTTGSGAFSAASFGVQVSDSEAGDGAIGCSGDTGVAITSEGQPAVDTSSGATTTTTTTTTTATTKASAKKDTTPPTTSLSTNLSKPYVSAPIISGSASDSGGVNSVEYSTDGGGSWIAASVKGKGEKQVTFSFSLGVLDDGNYTFLVRAKDTGGNVSEAKSYTIVIDRLPPQVGTTIFSAGPQILTPTKEGVLVSVAGLEQKITLSAIGGPISLEVTSGDEKFNLERNPESGLWSGTIKFDNPGTYELTSKSVDGAKNETLQKLANVLILEPGKVSYRGKPAPGAAISVYVFEPTLGQFILWDGVSYGQSNPQKTNENGNYSLLLPAGRYYLEAKLSAFIKLRTQIFELSAPSVINADLSGGSFSIPLIANEIKIEPIKGLPADIKIESELIGSDFPLALVKEVTGVELASGKPQIVSILATWLPDTAEQIKILESLEAKEFGVTVIVPQESKPAVEIFAKRGRYNLTLLADPDGKLVEPLLLRFLPTHFFLDENAKIKMIRFGVLNKEELLENAR